MDSRLAVLDCGTNSTRFLLAECSGDRWGPDTVLDRGMVVTRLGEGVDETGRLSEGAIRRVVTCVRDFQDRVQEEGGRWVGGIATHACRRASNREEFLDELEARIGVRPEVVSGEEEARLTGLGVRAALSRVTEGRIVDIGGGSTEWICFDRRGVESARSLSIGVVTLLERCVDRERWNPDIDRCVRENIRRELPPDPPGEGPLIVVGGTGTTVSAMVQQLREYDSDRVHGHRVSRDQLDALMNTLRPLTVEEIGGKAMISPGREDVIMPGIAILQECLNRAGEPRFVVSDYGVLAGCLEDFLRP